MHWDCDFTPVATMTDAVREWAYNVGHMRPDDAWLLSDYDTWERNPFYVGPAVPHPESDYDYDFGLVVGPVESVDPPMEFPVDDDLPF